MVAGSADPMRRASFRSISFTAREGSAFAIYSHRPHASAANTSRCPRRARSAARAACCETLHAMMIMHDHAVMAMIMHDHAVMTMPVM